VVHTVVTGGQALLDTLHGVAQLVKQLDSVRFVVWLNPFWGPIAEDGKTFEQMKTYQDIKKRIETVISLPAFTDELFPQDIAGMCGPIPSTPTPKVKAPPFSVWRICWGSN
jgi:hypothetical protein